MSDILDQYPLPWRVEETSDSPNTIVDRDGDIVSTFDNNALGRALADKVCEQMNRAAPVVGSASNLTVAELVSKTDDLVRRAAPPVEENVPLTPESALESLKRRMSQRLEESA